MKNILPRFAFALLAILVLAAVLLTLGQRESQAHPSANSYNPSGLHAFYTLLQQNGVPVEISRLEQPKLNATDLVIAPYVEEGFDIFRGDPLEVIRKSLRKHVQRGGKVLVLPFSPDFRASSWQAIQKPTELTNALDGEQLKVHFATVSLNTMSFDEDMDSFQSGFLSDSNAKARFIAWTSGPSQATAAFLTLERSGKGTVARTVDGLFTTNRFIDRADDAQLALRIVRSLLPEGGKVVFSEATLGSGIEPSLISTLGPWAVGAWMQLLVLFLVIVATLGIRFGLPLTEMRRQRGQREMLDAIADVYLRARSSAVALDAAYVAADTKIRRAHKLPAGLTDQERNQLVPEFADIMTEVDFARKPHFETDRKGRQRLVYRLKPKEARDLIAKLDQKLAEHLPTTQNRLS